MSKTPNHSTPRKKRAKDLEQEDHCINDTISAEHGIFTYRQIPLNESVATEIAKDFLKYCRSEKKGLSIARYCKMKGIARFTFDFWCTKYPPMAAAKKIGKTYIGDNREIGGLTRKLDPSLVRATMPLYNKEYKELEEWRSKLKTDESERDQTINVIMPKVERVIDNGPVQSGACPEPRGIEGKDKK